MILVHAAVVKNTSSVTVSDRHLNYIRSIALVGTGNVATRLGESFFASGIEIKAVFGRDSKKRDQLAAKLGAKTCTDLSELKADLILICVKDDAIQEVSQKIQADQFVAHTSGSVSLEALETHERRGVLYPLQTLTATSEQDLSQVPFLIEGSSEELIKELAELAAKISEDVQVCNSFEREQIHMAAVIVNNFTNHLVSTAKSILSEKGIDWRILLPLLSETVRKLYESEPESIQTGPAIRGDQQTIERHMESLSEKDGLLYQLFSERISQQKTAKDHEEL